MSNVVPVKVLEAVHDVVVVITSLGFFHERIGVLVGDQLAIQVCKGATGGVFKHQENPFARHEDIQQHNLR